MTRAELIKHLLLQARNNGFELRRWFRNEAALPWPGGDEAVNWLAQGTRIHHLLGSQSFAQHFFGGTERVRQVQPASVFQRTGPNGVTRTVFRKAYPRTSRYDEVWRYHLQRMMIAPEPLRYAQRFLVSADLLKQKRPQAMAPLPPRPSVEVDYDDELLVREDPQDLQGAA